jgi:peptide/nickel transport system substrate-binding protein
MKFTRSAKFALAAAASAALAVSLLTPAQAVTRSTVILHQTNAQTGLNCSLSTTNSTVCTEQASLTGMGFNYYNDKKELVKNTIFGSYKIVKNTATDFRVQYTVNPGRVWSDGTPITGVDLLLSHVTQSDAYSKSAGLGDPTDSKAPAFDGLGYSSTYAKNIVGEPTLSSDKMSVTLRWKNPIANWDLYGPGPSPVHALVLLSEGKTSLQSDSANLAAKARFLKAFQDQDTAALKKMGDSWSNDYNVTTINNDTNPLLLISNGGFIVKSAVKDTSMTFELNENYNSGPAMDGSVKTVIFKRISDGTAATQALANGELDMYAGQATADAVAALNKITSVKVVGADAALYEHWDLHYDTVDGEEPYTGLFSVKYGAKSKALRQAFLLGLPRDEIMEKLIAPINGKETPLCTTWVAPGTANYNKVCASNGGSFYTRGTQASRNKSALALVKKYYPNALKSPVRVNVLVPANNTRRAAEFALAKANLAKVGFDLVGDSQVGWGGLLGNSKYDAFFFGWSASAVTQRQSCGTFEKDGGSNYVMGYQNNAFDAICNSMYVPLKESILLAKYIQAERITNADAVSLPVFTHPGIYAINKDLKGIKPAPLSPNLTWNYWEWNY